MLFENYFALDKLKEIERKLNVLGDLIVSNSDGSQQDHITTICEDIEDKLTLCMQCVGDLPDTDRVSAFHRHLWFIRRYPHLAEGNFHDIREADYPTIHEIVLDKIAGMNFVHKNLYEACVDLYAQRQYTATIRAAFVAWKAYCCKTLNLDSTLDGHKLIDRLFSPSGIIREDQPDDVQKAFHEYCKSSFSFFRNKLSHNMYKATSYDVDAALAALNLMLFKVDRAISDRT